MKRLVLCLLLFLPAVAQAHYLDLPHYAYAVMLRSDDKQPAPASAPVLKIPEEVKPNGQYVQFTPDTDCVAVVYVGLDSVDPLPSGVLKDGRMFVLDTRGLPTGRYRFAAVGAGKDGQQARADFVVVVGTPPKPPDPPGPQPPPAGTFERAVWDAYAAEAGPDRAYQAAFLGSLYGGAATLLDDPRAATVGDATTGLFALLSTAMHANPKYPKGSLPLISKVIGADFNTALGGAAGGVDPAKPTDKAAAKAAFARYAAALNALAAVK